MKKTLLSRALLLATVMALGQTRKPNIVLVLIDGYGWADTGCYGSTYRDEEAVNSLALFSIA